MARKLIATVLGLVVFTLFSFTTLAQDLTVEQLQANLPNISVWFYAPTQPAADEVTLSIGEQNITASSVGAPDTDAKIHHYFLVDTSTSTTAEQLAAVQAALNDFADDMTQQDVVTLISFGVEVQTLVDSSTDTAKLTEKAASLQANEAGTVFFDALATVSDLAKQESLSLDRKLLYVFSDSVDYNVGGYTAQEAQTLLNDAGLTLYAFGFDTGTKENLDNFGALARSTGGYISVVNSSDLLATFDNVASSLQSDVYIAKFNATSNVLIPDGAQLSLTAGQSSEEFSAYFNYSTPDTTAPQLLSVTQTGEGTLNATFSEPVAGANIADNYIVSDEQGELIGVTAAAFDAQSNSTVLTLANLPASGELTLRTSGITDMSAQQNDVANELSFDFINNTPPELSVISAQPVSAGAYIFIGLLGAGIITAVAVGTVKKRAKAEQQAQEQLSMMQADVPMQQHVMPMGQTGRAHFAAVKQSDIILDVANISGKGRSVKLPISGSMFVGRSDICDVIFDDVKMSRQHFVIEKTSEGFNITNLSPGGTYLNGVLINDTRPLVYGDKIFAGSQTIVFKPEKG